MTYSKGSGVCLDLVLARNTSMWTDGVWVADSTPVECARS